MFKEQFEKKKAAGAPDTAQKGFSFIDKNMFSLFAVSIDRNLQTFH